MQTYLIKPHGQYGQACSIVNLESGSYIIPGWHPVTRGTTLDQIKWDLSDLAKPQPKLTFQAKSSSRPDLIHTVTKAGNHWSCTCASGQWRRGDCRHIKQSKQTLTNKL